MDLNMISVTCYKKFKISILAKPKFCNFSKKFF